MYYYMPIVSFCGAIVWADTHRFLLNKKFSLVLILLIGGIATFLLSFFFLPQAHFRFKKFLLFLLIIFIFVMLGIFLTWHALESHVKNGEAFLAQPITLEGIVVDDPELRAHNRRVTFSVETPFKATILVSTPIFSRNLSDLRYGDRLQLWGQLRNPVSFQSGDGRWFDYEEYLASQDVDYLFTARDGAIISRDNGNILKGQLLKFKKLFLGRLDELLPEPYSSLAGGLVIAGKRSLSADLQEKFKRVGIIHIVVLSGQNVTIVAEAMMQVFALLPTFIPKIFGSIAGALGIVLFSLMAGGSATVIRAVIMALIAVFARETSRSYNASRALWAACFIMLCVTPSLLLHNPSFQLSFLATLGLIIFSPPFEHLFRFLPEKYGIRPLVVATFSTQFATLPLLLYTTGGVSLVALPVNLLVVPLVPLTMFFSFVMGISAFVSVVLALPSVFAAYILLAFELGVVDVGSNLPYAYTILHPFSFGWSIGAYIFLLGAASGYHAFYLPTASAKRSSTTSPLRLVKKASTYFFFSEGG
ncbi:MAG: ComEC/Rec2 family competence protein [Candidatus Pacebacteria bacterium]|nr:ComEC/Rec2 family competence protein [Candidatus Paceibacterota bacterium]